MQRRAAVRNSVSQPASAAKSHDGPVWEAQALARTWHFLTSMKAALVLIFVIAGLVLAGTLLNQVPPSIAANDAAYSAWLKEQRGTYGAWTNLLEKLQLFNVFHVFYFRAIMGALCLSLVACTMNRIRPTWNAVFHSRVRMGEPFFAHARYHATISTNLSPAEASDAIRRSMRRARYRIAADAAPGSIAILGDKNRLSPFGTFLTHLSLVVILGGALASGIFGFNDPEFMVSEGTSKPLGNGTGISVQLDQFADEYYVDGPPRDYRSDIVLFDNGKQVKAGTVRVNEPLRYKGFAFHQSFYGQTAVMTVADASGKVIFNDSVPLAWQTQDGLRSAGSFTLPGQGLTAYVIGPAQGDRDPLIPAGMVRLEVSRSNSLAAQPSNLTQGTPAEVAGLTFTFVRESRFAGLKVVKDPGTNIIWVGGAMLVLGMVALFYLPRRRFWALCKPGPDGTNEVLIAMTAQRDMSLAREFAGLENRIARAVGNHEHISSEGDNDA